MKVGVFRFAFCVIASASLAACGVGGRDANGSDVSMVDGTNPDDWPSYGRTYGEQHFSPLDQINADTVDRLSLEWSLDLPLGNSTTQPIVVDGVIYFARAYSVVNAVDAVTGKLLWEYDSRSLESNDEKGKPISSWGSRGIGWWNGKVYTLTIDGRLIALNAGTGKPVWESLALVGEDDISHFTMPPRVFDGVVIVGNSGDNGKMRGYAVAYDAESGEELWRFWVVPGNPADGFERPELEMAAKTWSGEWWEYGGNGAPWHGFTYDPETGTIFIGTGNGFPFNHRLRSAGEGDNLFLSSVVALDLKSGKYKWHYQGTPADTWDYTMTQDIQLADLEIDGKRRKVLMTAPKNGFFYVIDRTNGEFMSAEPFVKTTWATHYDYETGRPVENPAARYPGFDAAKVWPTVFGGHNWQAQSYSPQTKLAYIPVVDLGGTYADNLDTTEWDPENGKLTTGVNTTGDVDLDRPEEATAALIAWDPVKQKRVWRVESPYIVPAGTMATAGGLVFQGGVEGMLNAFSAADGKKLWSYDMQAPGVIAPVTYAVDGKQYVTILTGTSGVPAAFGRPVQQLGNDYRTIARRVLTFALDGKATLPKRQIVARKKLDDPDYKPNPALGKVGAKLYNVSTCGVCHGYDGISGGRAPDLRYSPMSLDAEAFASVVKDGALLTAGMPKFPAMSDENVEAIRHFIRAQAHDPEIDKPSRKTGMKLAL